jgi:hypothetical protein
LGLSQGSEIRWKKSERVQFLAARNAWWFFVVPMTTAGNNVFFALIAITMEKLRVIDALSVSDAMCVAGR